MTVQIIGPVKIKDGLFMGDECASQDIAFIMQNKITHIVNCAGKQVQNSYCNFNIQYLTFPWLEADHEILFDEDGQNLQRVYDFIMEAQSLGESTLVHSVKGQSRACCIVAAFLMKRKQDLEIRANFFHQLNNLEQKLHAANQLTSSNWLQSGMNFNDDDDDDEDVLREELITRNTFLNAKNNFLADNNNTTTVTNINSCNINDSNDKEYKKQRQYSQIITSNNNSDGNNNITQNKKKKLKWMDVASNMRFGLVTSFIPHSTVGTIGIVNNNNVNQINQTNVKANGRPSSQPSYLRSQIVTQHPASNEQHQLEGMLRSIMKRSEKETQQMEEKGVQIQNQEKENKNAALKLSIIDQLNKNQNTQNGELQVQQKKNKYQILQNQYLASQNGNCSKNSSINFDMFASKLNGIEQVRPISMMQQSLRSSSLPKNMNLNQKNSDYRNSSKIATVNQNEKKKAKILQELNNIESKHGENAVIQQRGLNSENKQSQKFQQPIFLSKYTAKQDNSNGRYQKEPDNYNSLFNPQNKQQGENAMQLIKNLKNAPIKAIDKQEESTKNEQLMTATKKEQSIQNIYTKHVNQRTAALPRAYSPGIRQIEKKNKQNISQNPRPPFASSMLYGKNRPTKQVSIPIFFQQTNLQFATPIMHKDNLYANSYIQHQQQSQQIFSSTDGPGLGFQQNLQQMYANSQNYLQSGHKRGWKM